MKSIDGGYICAKCGESYGCPTESNTGSECSGCLKLFCHEHAISHNCVDPLVVSPRTRVALVKFASAAQYLSERWDEEGLDGSHSLNNAYELSEEFDKVVSDIMRWRDAVCTEEEIRNYSRK